MSTLNHRKPKKPEALKTETPTVARAYLTQPPSLAVQKDIEGNRKTLNPKPKTLKEGSHVGLLGSQSCPYYGAGLPGSHRRSRRRQALSGVKAGLKPRTRTRGDCGDRAKDSGQMRRTG